MCHPSSSKVSKEWRIPLATTPISLNRWHVVWEAWWRRWRDARCVYQSVVSPEASRLTCLIIIAARRVQARSGKCVKCRVKDIEFAKMAAGYCKWANTVRHRANFLTKPNANGLSVSAENALWSCWAVGSRKLHTLPGSIAEHRRDQRTGQMDLSCLHIQAVYHPGMFLQPGLQHTKSRSLKLLYSQNYTGALEIYILLRWSSGQSKSASILKSGSALRAMWRRYRRYRPAAPSKCGGVWLGAQCCQSREGFRGFSHSYGYFFTRYFKVLSRLYHQILRINLLQIYICLPAKRIRLPFLKIAISQQPLKRRSPQLCLQLL